MHNFNATARTPPRPDPNDASMKTSLLAVLGTSKGRIDDITIDTFYRCAADEATACAAHMSWRVGLCSAEGEGKVGRFVVVHGNAQGWGAGWVACDAGACGGLSEPGLPRCAAPVARRQNFGPLPGSTSSINGIQVCGCIS